jgi:hypothetical protein
MAAGAGVEAQPVNFTTRRPVAAPSVKNAILGFTGNTPGGKPHTRGERKEGDKMGLLCDHYTEEQIKEHEAVYKARGVKTTRILNDDGTFNLIG